MSKARDKALEAFPISFSERMGYKSANLPNERRNAFEKGYEQAEKDIAEHIKLAYGKVSMNPFDCSEAFEELLKTIGAV